MEVARRVRRRRVAVEHAQSVVVERLHLAADGNVEPQAEGVDGGVGSRHERSTVLGAPPPRGERPSIEAEAPAFGVLLATASIAKYAILAHRLVANRGGALGIQAFGVEHE